MIKFILYTISFLALLAGSLYLYKMDRARRHMTAEKCFNLGGRWDVARDRCEY